MTQKEAQDINMTHNEVEKDRKSICLKSVKNEHEYCNNNQELKCKLIDFEESKNKPMLSDEGVCSGEDNIDKSNGAINNNSDNDGLKEDEIKSTSAADTNHPITMNLRKFRRATVKKQILDNMSKSSNKLEPTPQKLDFKGDVHISKSGVEINENTRKRKLSETKHKEGRPPGDEGKVFHIHDFSTIEEPLGQSSPKKCSKLMNNKVNVEENSDQATLVVHTKKGSVSEEDNRCFDKSRTITESSENNSMTLQQFTDIVLASEGLSTTKDGKKSDQSSPPTPSTPHRKNSLQSSCGGDDEASNSSPTHFSSVLHRKESTESINKQLSCDNPNKVPSNTKKSPNNINSNVKLEQFDNGYNCNNNILDSTTHNAMVANIMNNKDLTVEVKPMNVKPVVLSPRYPNGYNYHFQEHSTKDYNNAEISNNNNNPWHSKPGQNGLLSSTRYYSSVRPRVQRYDSDNSSCSGDIIDSKRSPLPQGRPPSIPKMVEEWLQKMQPPHFEEEDNHLEGNVEVPTNENSVTTCQSVSQSVPRKHKLILRDPQSVKTNSTTFQTECDSNTVLNLSTKDCLPKSPSTKLDEKQQQEHQHVQKVSNNHDIQTRDSNEVNNGKPTQVYLRPIPTNQMTQHPHTNAHVNTLPKSHMSSQGKQQSIALQEHGQKPRCPEYEQIVILGRHNRKDQYPSEQNRLYCNPNNGSRANITHKNIEYYPKQPSGHTTDIRNLTVSVNHSTHHLSKSRQILSPPNLEITRISSYPKNSPPEVPQPVKVDRITRNTNGVNLHSSTIPNNKNLGRSFPLDSSNTDRESIRARAIRDIQLSHTKDVHGNYPIHIAVLMRKPEHVKRYCCVLQILESTIDLQNDDKLTPLHLAIRDNSLEIIELLLAFGADPALRDNKGNSGLHVAAALGASACLQLLAGNTKHKEDLNELNDCGITPLQISMMNSDKISTDILIRSGANLKLVDPKLLQSKHGSLIPLGTANVK